jgi:ATP-binding cassette subfamily B protein
MKNSSAKGKTQTKKKESKQQLTISSIFPHHPFSFLFYFLKKQPVRFFFAQLFCLAWAIDQAVFPLLFSRVIDGLIHYKGDRTFAWEVLSSPILWCLFLWILMELFFRAQGFILAKALPKLESDIRLSIFRYVQNHSYRFFSENFSGNISQKISDISNCSSRITHTLFSVLVPAFCALILAGVMLYRVSPFFCLLIEIWLTFHFLVSFCLSCQSSRLSAIHSQARSELTGRIVDSLTNYLLIKIFHKKRREFDFIAHFQDDERQKHQKTLLVIEKYRIILGLLTFIGPGLLINYYAFSGWKEGWISVAEVVLIFTLIWNIASVMWVAGSELPTFFSDVGTVIQGLDLVSSPFEVTNAPNSIHLVPKDGKITFDNITFGYTAEKLIFSNLSFQIDALEKIGIVGYSGSGKSTLISLILRLFDLQNGKILIDDQDISQVTQKSLRRAISYVPQNPCLFHRTILDNIRYSREEATDEEVIEAARLAHAHEFIEKLPQGYQTMCGERGVKLSGGQRQRIEIARSCLNHERIKILIFDEATSALDSVTEKLIQESLDFLMKSKTTIVIAHRLSTLVALDRLIVLDKGNIDDTGSHAELSKRDGLYKKLWQTQIDGFIQDNTVVV